MDSRKRVDEVTVPAAGQC